MATDFIERPYSQGKSKMGKEEGEGPTDVVPYIGKMENLDLFYRHRAHPPTGSHVISVPFPPQKEHSGPLAAKVMNSNSLS